jgi:hypothetical protein
MNNDINHLEACVKYCRRSIQLALTLIIVFGLIAIVQIAIPGAEVVKKDLMTLLPIYIVIAIVWIFRLKKKTGVSNNSSVFRMVMEDELRIQSLNRTFRHSFIFVIISQIPMAYFFNMISITSASIVQSILTIVLGVTTFLTLFLIYDR